MARVMEAVAQHAARGHLAGLRLRAPVAFAARLDRRHRHVARSFRARDIVAIGAFRLRVGAMVEHGRGHPSIRRARLRDGPGRHVGALALCIARDLVARLAGADLHQVDRDLARLARRQAERALALRRRGLSHAAKQSLAGNAERLLETVGHATKCQRRVELVDHRHGVRGLAVGDLARRDRRLDLEAVAFLAILRHGDRLEHALRGIRTVAVRALEPHAALRGRLDAVGIEVLLVGKREMRIARRGNGKRRMRLREIRNVLHLRIGRVRMDVAVAIDAEGVVVACAWASRPCAPCGSSRSARPSKSAAGCNAGADVMPDLRVAFQAGSCPSRARRRPRGTRSSVARWAGATRITGPGFHMRSLPLHGRCSTRPAGMRRKATRIATSPDPCGDALRHAERGERAWRACGVEGIGVASSGRTSSTEIAAS